MDIHKLTPQNSLDELDKRLKELIDDKQINQQIDERIKIWLTNCKLRELLNSENACDIPASAIMDFFEEAMKKDISTDFNGFPQTSGICWLVSLLNIIFVSKTSVDLLYKRLRDFKYSSFEANIMRSLLMFPRIINFNNTIKNEQELICYREGNRSFESMLVAWLYYNIVDIKPQTFIELEKKVYTYTSPEFTHRLIPESMKLLSEEDPKTYVEKTMKDGNASIYIVLPEKCLDITTDIYTHFIGRCCGVTMLVNIQKQDKESLNDFLLSCYKKYKSEKVNHVLTMMFFNEKLRIFEGNSSLTGNHVSRHTIENDSVTSSEDTHDISYFSNPDKKHIFWYATDEVKYNIFIYKLEDDIYFYGKSS
jgi:hypothetical protein